MTSTASSLVASSSPPSPSEPADQQKDQTAAAAANGAEGSPDLASVAPAPLFGLPADVVGFSSQALAFGLHFPGAADQQVLPVHRGQLQQQPFNALVQQERRTVFMAGFPSTMTERELHCLLTFIDGFQVCQLTYNSNTPQGFALFRTQADALAAVQHLAGHQLELGCVLRAELAHKNLVVKREIVYNASGPPVYHGNNSSYVNNRNNNNNGNSNNTDSCHTRTDAIVQQTLGGGLPFCNLLQGVPVPPPQPHFNLHSTFGALPGLATPPGLLHGAHGAPLPPFGPIGSTMSGAQRLANQHAQHLSQHPAAPPPDMRDNPPCNTLFLGNLSEHALEEELVAIMAPQPGYKQTKWSPTGKGNIAFVEFESIAAAAITHRQMQGAIIPGNDRGPIRIEYSKNPLGKKSPETTTLNTHGLFDAPGAAAAPAPASQPPAPAAVAQPFQGQAIQAQAEMLYSAATLAAPVGLGSLNPRAGFMGALDVPAINFGSIGDSMSAAATAMAVAAATQGMGTNPSLFGSVSNMLL